MKASLAKLLYHVSIVGFTQVDSLSLAIIGPINAKINKMETDPSHGNSTLFPTPGLVYMLRILPLGQPWPKQTDRLIGLRGYSL